MNELKKLLENAGLPIKESMSDDELKDWIDHGLATTRVGGSAAPYYDDIADYLRAGDIVSAIKTAMQDKFYGNNRTVEADLHGVFKSIIQQAGLSENADMDEGLDDDLRYAEKYGTTDEDLDWGDELIEDLKLLVQENQHGKIDPSEIMSLIQQYEA